MLYALVLALVALDQAVKYLVRAHIPLGESIPFLPHILDLTYVQNTGAAFSIFREHTWLLALLSLIVSILLYVALARKWITRHPLGRTCLAMVLAGAVGNLIDRARLQFVTDMFQTTFIDFPVFNVADICIVVGGIAFCLYYLLLFEKLEGKEGGHDPSGTAR